MYFKNITVGIHYEFFSDQICVPDYLSLTQRIFVAQMDVSLQWNDENSTKGDHLRYSLYYVIIWRNAAIS